MAVYSDLLFLELVQASFALNEVKKTWILNNSETITLADRRKLFTVLVNEQLERKKLNDRQIQMNKQFLHDQTILVNDYNEKLVDLQEKNSVEGLETAFDNIFDN